MGKDTKVLVNGQTREVDAGPDTTLLEVLRNDLGLIGAKYGCGEGQCGGCTVLIEGKPTRSCVTLLSTVGMKPVITIEGLEKQGKLHPVQQAYLDEGAMQCGYCVSGMIMSAVGLLSTTPDPTEAQIVEHMEGNVCRCCGYAPMLAAIKRAAKAMQVPK